MIMIDLLLIAVIVSTVINLTDFFDTIERYIAKWLGVKEVHIKLLECSLCTTHWVGLIYLIFTNNFNLYIYTYLLILSFFTDILTDIIQLIKDMISTLITKINDFIF